MRILLALVLIASLAACGKKKSPATPAATPAAESATDDEMKEKSSPDADDDAAPDTKSADPQEGGQ
jgi:predicted small lipoprotein YifL